MENSSFQGLRTVAFRMALLLVGVGALDALAAWQLDKPLRVCAVIPILIPLLMPAVFISTWKTRKS